jgi:SAM-dependent methyltransferase
MGKSRKEGPGSGKGKKPSSAANWTFYAVAAVIVGIFAWSSIKPIKTHKAKAKAVQDDSDYETDDRIDAIREALFSEDGRYNFARDGSGARKNGSRFSEAEYWENRYTKSKAEHYDWYGTWNSESKIRIKPHVVPWMPDKVESVLNVGCGNSRLAEELMKDGYTDVMSVDIAQAAIDKMTEKFKGTPLRFMQMDATKMTFEDETFDVVFDKGTLDAMYTGASDLVKLAVAQIFRVLRPGGLFVSLTFGHPNSRKDLNYTTGVQLKEGELPGWERSEIKRLHKDNDGLPDKQTFWMYLFKKPLKP